MCFVEGKIIEFYKNRYFLISSQEPLQIHSSVAKGLPEKRSLEACYSNERINCHNLLFRKIDNKFIKAN